MSVKLVNDVTALLSMRESYFDTYSAYGEALDNSIQANTKRIWIDFKTEKMKRGYEQIKRVSFMDDGDGMDANLVHHCLQLGYSSRFNDRSGIGRFGVGMTLGAIHECRRVDVFSKTSSSDRWLTTFVDLGPLSNSMNSDEVSINNTASQEPSSVDMTRPGTGKGTVISWSKYDRQMETASNIIEQAKVYIGRTFRKFIWDGLEFFVNGEKVLAIDPLYVTTEGTKFSGDKPGKEVSPIVIKWGCSRGCSRIRRTEVGDNNSTFPIARVFRS